MNGQSTMRELVFDLGRFFKQRTTTTTTTGSAINLTSILNG